MPELTERELAWAAGLFEGEGTVRISSATRNGLGHLAVIISNTDLQVLEFFQQRWPGYLKPMTGMRVDQRPAWQWAIAANKAATFLRAIAPFLITNRVKEKANVGLRFQEGKSRSSLVNRTFEYREAQWCDFMWMKQLNLRGNRACCDVDQFTRGARR